MPSIATNMRNWRESAASERFEPTTSILATNVQDAIEAVAALPPLITPTSVSTSPYNVLQTDTVLYVDTSGGPIQINLQAGLARGQTPLVIKDITGNAFTNNITLTPDGSETIDGESPLKIQNDFGAFQLNPRSTGYTVAP